MISDRELEEILKKYDFKWIHSDGVFGFYPDETSYHFCKIGSYAYDKIRVFDEIKIKHERIIGSSDKSTLCKNIEDVEKCLQNISAQNVLRKYSRRRRKENDRETKTSCNVDN